MNNRIEIEGYYKLLALHKTILEAKFHKMQENYDIASSPIIAQIAEDVINKIIEIESIEGLGREKNWESWLQVTHKHWIWERLIKFVIRDRLEWIKLDRDDKKEKTKYYFAPFIITEENIEIFINEVELKINLIDNDLNNSQ